MISCTIIICYKFAIYFQGFQLSQDLSETEKSDLRAYCSMVSRILGNAEVIKPNTYIVEYTYWHKICFILDIP